MRYIRVGLLSVLFLLFFAKTVLAVEGSKVRTLTIYSNDSFARNWTKDKHPVKLSFEKKCKCKLEFVAIDSGGTLLSRLQLEGKNSKADIVVGLDMNVLAQAESTGLFAPHNVDTKDMKMPIKWDNKLFLPYDYGYFAFVYDSKKLKNPPKSLEELINGKNDIKVIIQDPRSSTAGLGLLAWIKSIYGDEASGVWTKFLKKIVTVTRSWGESYGLFLHGEADMVLSYSTSPVYHMIVENNHDIKAANFEEGHYMQVEVLAKLKSSKEPELADQFLQFVLSKDFQISIPSNNFMYPVIELGGDLPKEFISLTVPGKILIHSKEEIYKNRKRWLQEWLDASSRH